MWKKNVLYLRVFELGVVFQKWNYSAGSKVRFLERNAITIVIMRQFYALKESFKDRLFSFT
jgi:hypothetical protein